MTLKQYIIATLNARDIKPMLSRYDSAKRTPLQSLMARIIGSDDSRPDKNSVSRWDTEQTYVYVYGDADQDEYCDVEVQVGQSEISGLWYLHTTDDAGGSDDMDITPYATEEDARQAAAAYADKQDESEEATAGKDAQTAREERIEELTAEDGDWQITDKDDGIIASAATEDDAAILLMLMREVAGDNDEHLQGAYIQNLSTDAKETMERLTDEDGSTHWA